MQAAADTPVYRRDPSGWRLACRYIAGAYHYGDPNPFCGAPQRPGSAYCEAHHLATHVRLGAAWDVA